MNVAAQSSHIQAEREKKKGKKKKDPSSICSAHECDKWPICFSGKLGHAIGEMTYNNDDLGGPHPVVRRRHDTAPLLLRKLNCFLRRVTIS